MPTAIETLVTTLGSVVTFLVGKFGAILTLFTTNVLLILMLGIMVTGGIIGLSIRVLKRR